MRIALVHDYLVQYGGAERVLEAFCELYPDAPIYTLIHDPTQLYGAFESKKIYTSFIQKIPFAKKHHRFFPPLMPIGVEDFDLGDYDVVLSSSNSYAKGVITRPKTLHVSYCHTPMRYAWDDCHRYFNEFRYSRLIKMFIPFVMNYIRMWDKVSADRVDYYIANSGCVSKRIKKYYKMDSHIIYPPVDVENFDYTTPPEDFYLMLGRFLPYKHYDIVIKAFNNNNRKLVIIGEGGEGDYLRSLAKDNPRISFLGRLSDLEARKYYAKCKGFIFPSEDDFGIVPVEAMSSGKPVIAYGAGGALETVIDGKTGVFFPRQHEDDVNKALDTFEKISFDSILIRNHAMTFNKDQFKTNIKQFIDQKYALLNKTN